MMTWRPSKFGSHLDLGESRTSAFTRSSTLRPEILVRHLAAAEAQRDLDLVAFLEEAASWPSS